MHCCSRVFTEGYTFAPKYTPHSESSRVRFAKLIAHKQWVVTGADDKSVVVHPTLPYVLSASNDMLIKLWDWEKGWECTQTLRNIAFSPKDTNTLANLESHSFPAPDFTLDGFMSGSKPYLISGSDDHTAKAPRMGMFAYGMEPLIGQLEITVRIGPT
ncbi:Coatomer subunit beta'-2 [Vitis vinifera]|uniref:Coatomer subunit beta'-2 n=1 Tax=Vitis vinifera TaxID=29760 RepID=A0A438HU71_VITVI|nr:Coatomer subunit beta'-2 [Vitis vinifera]